MKQVSGGLIYGKSVPGSLELDRKGIHSSI